MNLTPERLREIDRIVANYCEEKSVAVQVVEVTILNATPFEETEGSPSELAEIARGLGLDTKELKAYGIALWQCQRGTAHWRK